MFISTPKLLKLMLGDYWSNHGPAQPTQNNVPSPCSFTVNTHSGIEVTHTKSGNATIIKGHYLVNTQTVQNE